jgi:hypothetical protein
MKSSGSGFYSLVEGGGVDLLAASPLGLLSVDLPSDVLPSEGAFSSDELLLLCIRGAPEGDLWSVA